MLRVVALLLVILTGSCFVPQHGLEVYVRERGEFWEASNVERVEVVFADKFRFTATSHHVDRIDLPYSQFKRLVEFNFKRRIIDIVRIIHNHPPDGCPGLSPSDREFLAALRCDGFTGRFVVWYKGWLCDY